jgi:hypothetical protein
MFLQLTKNTFVEMKMCLMPFFFCCTTLCAGGFFHGVRSLSFGVDLQEIRLMGVLQVYVVMRVSVMSYVFCPYGQHKTGAW